MGWTNEELEAVDFIMASYISPFIPGAGERAWGVLVGGAGTGKTELLRAFEGITRTVYIDHLTENAFCSSYVDPEAPEKDMSLLYRLSRESVPLGPKVLVMSEMSSFLTMKTEKVAKIFSDLRTAFDGKYSTQAGNKGYRSYDKLGFGLLGASTEVFDEFLRRNQTLGERVMICRIARKFSSYEARRAISLHVGRSTNRLKKDGLRKAIQNIVRDTMKEVLDKIEKEEIGFEDLRTPEMNDRLAIMGNIATSIRCVPLSDHSYVSTGEVASRLSQQAHSWGDARVVFDGRDKWDEKDYNLVKRILQDTMPPENMRLMQALWRSGGEEAARPMSVSDVASAARVPQEVASRQLHQWTVIGNLVRTQSSYYALRKAMVDDMVESGFME